MSLMKEVFRLRRNVGKLTDGQVTVGDLKPDEQFSEEGNILDIVIEPNAGLYKGGRFSFQIFIPNEYPHSEMSPVVVCNCHLLHPNIDTTEERHSSSTTNVCLNILENGTWDNSFGLAGIIHGLLFLLHNPNFEDPLSPYFESCDCEEGEEDVIKFMSGEEIEGLKLSTNFESVDKAVDENTVVVKNEIDHVESDTDVNGNENSCKNNVEGEGKEMITVGHDMIDANITKTEDEIEAPPTPVGVSDLIDDVAIKYNLCETIDNSNSVDENDILDDGSPLYKMIFIDGEVFLATDDVQTEIEIVDNKNNIVNDNQTANSETRNDQYIVESHIPNAIIVEGECVLKDIARQNSYTDMGMNDPNKNLSIKDVSMSCENGENKENLSWSALGCMCIHESRRTTLIDKVKKRLFNHFRTVGRRVLLIFDTDR